MIWWGLVVDMKIGNCATNKGIQLGILGMYNHFNMMYVWVCLKIVCTKYNIWGKYPIFRTRLSIFVGQPHIHDLREISPTSASWWFCKVQNLSSFLRGRLRLAALAASISDIGYHVSTGRVKSGTFATRKVQGIRALKPTSLALQRLYSEWSLMGL